MIQPLSDKIAVKVTVKSKTSDGGIALLKDTDPDAPMQGEIVAVGPGSYNDDGVREALEVAIGDIVAFPTGAGIEVSKHGVTVMRESEIIAVVG